MATRIEHRVGTAGAAVKNKKVGLHCGSKQAKQMDRKLFLGTQVLEKLGLSVIEKRVECKEMRKRPITKEGIRPIVICV